MKGLIKFISSLFTSTNDTSRIDVTQGASIKCILKKNIKLDIEMGGILPFTDHIILKMK